MMTFAALMSIILAAMLLILLGDDIRENGIRPNPEDRIMDVFVVVSCLCVLYLGGHELLFQ